MKKDLAKLIHVSDKTYAKLQKVQRPRESYGEVADRAAEALLKKEEVSPENKEKKLSSLVLLQAR